MKAVSLKVIRWLLGRIILLMEFVMTPKGVQRDSVTQQKLNDEIKDYKLYQYKACPFCVKVRHAMKKQNMRINLVDAKHETHREDLLLQGGEVKVPCLRIKNENSDDTWLYESEEIIRFLNQKAELADSSAVMA